MCACASENIWGVGSFFWVWGAQLSLKDFIILSQVEFKLSIIACKTIGSDLDNIGNRICDGA